MYDDDINEVLTPNSLLFGRKLTMAYIENDVDVSENDESNLLSIKRNIENKILQFRKQWESEYLMELRDYH